MSEWRYNAEVIRVVDGDTVDLKVDLGFRVEFTCRFRLMGIDSPERGQPGWSEAAIALRTLLPQGQAVVIRTHHPRIRDPQDGFGRWLATIYLNSDPSGQSINDQMIAAGHAVHFPRV